MLNNKKIYTFAAIFFTNLLTKQSIFIMAYVITDDCVACGTCVGECPVEAISEGDVYVIDPNLCTSCGSCAEVCPSEAILPE